MDHNVWSRVWPRRYCWKVSTEFGAEGSIRCSGSVSPTSRSPMGCSTPPGVWKAREGCQVAEKVSSQRDELAWESQRYSPRRCAARVDAVFQGISAPMGPLPGAEALLLMHWLQQSQLQVPHTHEIVGGRREAEHPSHQLQAAMPQFPHPACGFHPAEDIFHPLALRLADQIPACLVVRPSIALLRPLLLGATCG
jgi:hypothetical protein